MGSSEPLIKRVLYLCPTDSKKDELNLLFLVQWIFYDKIAFKNRTVFRLNPYVTCY